MQYTLALGMVAVIFSSMTMAIPAAMATVYTSYTGSYTNLPCGSVLGMYVTATKSTGNLASKVVSNPNGGCSATGILWTTIGFEQGIHIYVKGEGTIKTTTGTGGSCNGYPLGCHWQVLTFPAYSSSNHQDSFDSQYPGAGEGTYNGASANGCPTLSTSNGSYKSWSCWHTWYAGVSGNNYDDTCFTHAFIGASNYDSIEGSIPQCKTTVTLS